MSAWVQNQNLAITSTLATKSRENSVTQTPTTALRFFSEQKISGKDLSNKPVQARICKIQYQERGKRKQHSDKDIQ